LVVELGLEHYTPHHPASRNVHGRFGMVSSVRRFFVFSLFLPYYILEDFQGSPILGPTSPMLHLSNCPGTLSYMLVLKQLKKSQVWQVNKTH
jgi:hypothetical protein